MAKPVGPRLATLSVVLGFLSFVGIGAAPITFAQTAGNFPSKERTPNRAVQPPPPADWGYQKKQEVDTAFAQRAKSLQRSLPGPEAEVVATVARHRYPAKALGAKHLLIPGAKIDGWIMHVDWCVPRREWDSIFERNMRDAPPIYEVRLRLPEPSKPRTSFVLWGFNYDFNSKRYTIPNETLKKLKRGDWVVVSGAVDPDTRVKWSLVKDDNFPLLTVGLCTLSDIKTLKDNKLSDK
jgi:hypothetical protein